PLAWGGLKKGVALALWGLAPGERRPGPRRDDHRGEPLIAAHPDGDGGVISVVSATRTGGTDEAFQGAGALIEIEERVPGPGQDLIVSHGVCHFGHASDCVHDARTSTCGRRWSCIHPSSPSSG